MPLKVYTIPPSINKMEKIFKDSIFLIYIIENTGELDDRLLFLKNKSKNGIELIKEDKKLNKNYNINYERKKVIYKLLCNTYKELSNI